MYSSIRANTTLLRDVSSRIVPTHLDGEGGDDVLGVDQSGAAQVVEASLGEDLGTSLEPDGLGNLDAVGGEHLGQHNAQGSEQGPAGVDHLQLAVLGEGLGVGREADGIPAVVTGELSRQVRGSGRGEGACEGKRGPFSTRRFEERI